MTKLIRLGALPFFLLLLGQVHAQGIITAVHTDLDSQIIVVIGVGFSANPILSMAAQNGPLQQLNVTNSSNTFVIGDLLNTSPGTYLVLVSGGPSIPARANITIGPTGPPGPWDLREC